MSKSKAENDECKIFTMSTALTHARARSVNALEVNGVFHRFHAARTNRSTTSEYRENEVKSRPLAILCCHTPRSLRSTAFSARTCGFMCCVKNGCCTTVLYYSAFALVEAISVWTIFLPPVWMKSFTKIMRDFTTVIKV